MSVSSYERASLRLQAFAMLKGWGRTGEDGKFRAWSGDELKPVADHYVDWALSGGGLYCSFCAKSEEDVKKLVAGPASITICNECVDLCHEIVHERPAEEAALPGGTRMGGDAAGGSGSEATEHGTRRSGGPTP
jgi:hypothetical protein